MDGEVADDDLDADLTGVGEVEVRVDLEEEAGMERNDPIGVGFVLSIGLVPFSNIAAAALTLPGVLVGDLIGDGARDSVGFLSATGDRCCFSSLISTSSSGSSVSSSSSAAARLSSDGDFAPGDGGETIVKGV